MGGNGGRAVITKLQSLLWLKQQKLIFPPAWRLEIGVQDVSRVDFLLGFFPLA